MNTELLAKAVSGLREVFPGAKPVCAIILGTGWSNVVENLNVKKAVSYDDIQCMGRSEVKGHAGSLLLAEFDKFEAFIFQGRRHWYEGAGWEPIALPIYIAVKFGVSVAVLTNAAGGIREDLELGDLLSIDDHINVMGVNPLVGNSDPAFGPQFSDQTEVYDHRLRELLGNAAANTGVKLKHGVYLATSGPVYETPSEIAMFRSMGADAVGMSTVPEAMLAHSAGLRVVGVSCITNLAVGPGRPVLMHDTVVNVAQKAQPKMKALLIEFLKEITSHVLNNEH